MYYEPDESYMKEIDYITNTIAELDEITNRLRGKIVCDNKDDHLIAIREFRQDLQFKKDAILQYVRKNGKLPD
jgi:adenylate kinase family enzyme